MEVHVLDVGQGNMVAIVLPDDFVLIYDCNITNDNEAEILAYLGRTLLKNNIDLFVNSHRDADHMRGIKKLHAAFPISALWDSGVSANTDTDEYRKYMEFRRSVTCHEVSSGQWLKAYPYIRVINGKRHTLDNPNAQSIVLHINHRGSEILLAGDSDVEAWSDYIVSEYPDSLGSLVLYASHHGSFSFFNDNSEKYKDYVRHMEKIRPAITVISVGATNPHGHPHPDSLSYYKQYSYGTVDSKMKIFRTDVHGNMRISFRAGGTGTIYWNQ